MATAAALWLALWSVASASPPGFDPKRHMPVDQIEPGMTGYGLTVFHGAEIKPFTVEVRSVERGFEPGKAVVWIRCPEDQMQLTGPVQGMSGSPIFLWSKDEAATAKPGHGGRMIGAFAYGYRMGKDCYVGVQPIEQMLESAARRRPPNEQADAGSGPSGGARQTAIASLRLAHAMQLPPQQTWRVRAIADLLGVPSDEQLLAEGLIGPSGLGGIGSNAESPQGAERYRMMLPVAVRDAYQAAMLEPFLSPFGLSAHAMAGAASSASPPKWVDPKQVKMQPGSVFSLPLVSGAQDLAAVGTTTEVLPDGTVLAFGHAFQGQGPIVVPMATGYVHFIQPSISSSFKIGGSLRTVGALVHDEQSAVIGTPGVQSKTVPSVVHVHYPASGQQLRYDYQVAHFRPMLPSLAAMTAAAAVTANSELPRISTIELKGRIAFGDGRVLDVHDIIPGGQPSAAMVLLATPIATMVDNQFAVGEVKSIETTVTIREAVEQASIIEATLRHDTVEPGGTIEGYVVLKPYRGESIRKPFSLTLPKDTAEGQYAISISDARTHYRNLMNTRPHLSLANSADDLWKQLELVMAIPSDALFLSVRLRADGNLAIGRTELPNLPSSRIALLADPTSTRTSPYGEMVEKIEKTPFVVVGQAALPIRVAKQAGEQ